MRPAQRSDSYADIMGLPVEYAGVNPVGQHLFKNGSPLVTDVFVTLEEAVKRFGKRLQTHDAQLRLSFYWCEGRKGGKYAPPNNAKSVDLVEYGLGYLRALMEETEKPKVAWAPANAALTKSTFTEAILAQSAVVPKSMEVIPPVIAPPPVDVEVMEMDDSAVLPSTPPVITAPQISASIGAIVKRGRGRPRKNPQ